jgi:class III poly(R)-hydroxyalkanoic acid synthase PhaE subunit
MQDRDTHDGEWVAAWIARQREIFGARSSEQQDGERPDDLGRRWVDAGKSFLDGLRQFASAAPLPSGESLDPFNVGESLLGAWTSATALQSGMAEQLAELFGRLPPIGLAREHTEAWRELAAAHAECKRVEHDLRAVIAKVQLDALDLLEKRVNERESSSPIDSFRTLYDLWVECGEQIFGELAHSAAYSKLQAELGNATMRLRSRLQTVIEQGLKQFDLPTRSELNSLHRQVRELRLELEKLTASKPPQPQRSQSNTSVSRKPTAKRKAKARTR